MKSRPWFVCVAKSKEKDEVGNEQKFKELLEQISSKLSAENKADSQFLQQLEKFNKAVNNK